MKDSAKLPDLVNRYRNNECTLAEVKLLHQYLQDEQYKPYLQELLGNGLVEDVPRAFLTKPEVQVALTETYRRIVAARDASNQKRKQSIVWPLRIAAAVLIFLSAGLAIYWHDSVDNQTQFVRQYNRDVLPGGNRALLTLADGDTIDLSTEQVGIIVGDEMTYVDGTSVIPSGRGTDILYATLTTPRGGQYKVTLQDGTNVWLNAASSLRYPMAFDGKERRVEVVGEAYFEVAPDKTKPFKVNINQQAEIEVLGTHFNVNAHADEKWLRTTLLEGSVRISKGDETTVLKAGQEAVIVTNIDVIDQADIDKAMAWRNGLFNFEGATLKEVMKQLERWYDIEVSYEGSIPEFRFGGEINKSNSLKEVLFILEKSEVSFRMERGRKLIVTGV